MKRCHLTLLASAALVAFVPAQAIVGSAHDATTWGLGINQVCVPCHAPHRALAPSEGPLWNHRITLATFTMYGTTVKGTATDPVPNRMSKLCLSCHDGVTAIDAFGAGAGTVNMATFNQSANVGTDLHDDHPISILYDFGVSTPGNSHGLKDPAQFTPGNYNNVPWLYSNKVECASCHDVHRRNAAIPDLLRVNKVNSELCLKCHDK